MAEEIKNTPGTEGGTGTQEGTQTPTVEELMTQLAQERAEKERFKNANDKLSKSEAEMKRQLRARQTAEEREAEEKAEADRLAKEEHERVVNELNHIKAVSAYKAIDDEKTVESLIEAISDADHNAIATIIANECKKAVAEAEAKWLKDRPRVSHGQYTNMSKEQIMAISNQEERLKAIAMNKHLF